MNITAWAAGLIHESVTSVADGMQTWVGSVCRSFSVGVESGWGAVSAVLTSLWAIVVLGVGFVLTRELTGSSRWASRRMMHAAVNRLPERRRDTRREEWKAEWESFGDAHLSRLLWAAGVWMAAWKIARRERPATVTGSGTATLTLTATGDGVIGPIEVTWVENGERMVATSGGVELRSRLGDDSSVTSIRSDMEAVLRDPPAGLKDENGRQQFTLEVYRGPRGRHRG